MYYDRFIFSSTTIHRLHINRVVRFLIMRWDKGEEEEEGRRRLRNRLSMINIWTMPNWFLIQSLSHSRTQALDQQQVLSLPFHLLSISFESLVENVGFVGFVGIQCKEQ